MFDSDSRGSKVVYANFVDCSLQEITSTIADLTGTDDILESSQSKKRRFVLQKDYNEYYDGLIAEFRDQFKSETRLSNVIRSLLTMIQNNIFYSITKFIKLIKFYRLNWRDDVRLLSHSNAFKIYLCRVTLESSEKAQADQLFDAKDLKIMLAANQLKRLQDKSDQTGIITYRL